MSKMSYEHSPMTTPFDARLWHQMLESKAEKHPDTEAVIMYDMDMTRSAMTYAEYRDRSMYLAASLLDLGLSRGQLVILIGPTTLRYIVFVMALHRIGANAILLGAGSLTQDKVELFKKLNCQMIAYDPEMKESQTKQLMEGINQLTQENDKILVSLIDNVHDLNKTSCHAYEKIMKRGESLDLQKLRDAQNDVQFDDPILALMTSGSTGKPKAVQFNTLGCSNFFSGTTFSPDNFQRVKFCVDRPVSWIGGYIAASSPLSTDMSVVIIPSEMALNESTVENVFQIWEAEKCQVSSIGTAHIQKLVSESMHLKYDLSHIKLILLGGQRFSLSSVVSIFERFPSVMLGLAYGCSEIPKMSTEIFRKENAVEGFYGKMTVSPGIEVQIVDDENKLVPRGTPGEICGRGIAGFMEYADDPEATGKARSPTGWFHSGDVGVMDDNGKIEVLGRKIEIIKRATVKIFPAEIENVLSLHPHVSDVVVVGIPDQPFHEEICACVVLREDAEDQSSNAKAKLQELEDWCKERWPPGPDGLSLKPKYFVPMNTIPMLPNGKISSRDIKAEAIKRLM